MLEIGDKVRVVKQTHKTEMGVVDIGDIGVLCDIDYTTNKLNHYVVFNSKVESDWFNEDELEVVE